MTPGSNPSPLTAREALQLGAERLDQAGVASARLDMSLILAEALGTDRLGLYTNMDRALSGGEREAARAMLARRLRREPMAYILGRREFYGLTLEVTPAVLIPRPETEHLVELAIGWVMDHEPDRPEPLMADIGTGSGAIAIAAACACRTSRWIATDVSESALEVARSNAQRHGVDGRIDFRLGSLLDPIAMPLDAICSNPPYVAERDRSTLEPDVIDYEPAGALFSGADGLDAIRELVATAPSRLKPGGLLAMECGQGQAGAIVELVAQQTSYGPAQIACDLAGIERVVWTEMQ